MPFRIAHRDFFLLHILRELSPKYRIPWVGIIWTVGQPLLSSLAVASFVGPRLVERLVTQQYFFYCWTGFSIWFFFSQSVQASCSTLNQKMKLVRGSLVPREYLALSPVIAGLIELVFNFAIITLVVIPVLGPSLSFKTPFFMGLALLCMSLFALGLGFWVSALCLLFQDLKYLVSFLLQLGFLCTPVIYSPRISGLKSALFFSNPVALSMKLMRAGIGVPQELGWGEVMGGTAFALLTFLTGYFYFQTKSKIFPELV
jgi:ABC-type polysaccharide/polyol phosphate export permease